MVIELLSALDTLGEHVRLEDRVESQKERRRIGADGDKLTVEEIINGNKEMALARTHRGPNDCESRFFAGI